MKRKINRHLTMMNYAGGFVLIGCGIYKLLVEQNSVAFVVSLIIALLGMTITELLNFKEV